MTLSFHENAWEDYLWWQQNSIEQNKQLLKRLNLLIKDIECDPYSGIGKPEALKHDLQGFWSRRISDEHRVVYQMDGDTLYIAQCRGHYI
jgi:toxin YoeB